MDRFLVLVRRDFRAATNKRLFFLLAFMALFQLWFIVGSGSVEKVLEAGRMEFMAVVFSFNILGSLAALVLSFDGISRERQNKTMDLILTSGVSKRMVMLSRAAANLAVSFVFSALYLLAVALVYAALGGGVGTALLCFGYLPGLTAFNFVYCLLGNALSVLFRSSRTSFIVSMAVGLVCMPRLFVTMLEGIAGTFGMGPGFIEIAGMASPALIMNALGGGASGASLAAAFIFLALYTAALTLGGSAVFTRQDELNYGE
jgi:ABC-type transport system involved in multi-copper enzyme maturation permease subunit